MSRDLTLDEELRLAQACPLCAEAATAPGSAAARCRASDAPPRHRIGGHYHTAATGPRYPVRLDSLHPGFWQSGGAVWATVTPPGVRVAPGMRAWLRGAVSQRHADGMVTVGGWAEQYDQGDHRVHYSPPPPVHVSTVFVDADLDRWHGPILRTIAAWAAARRGEEPFEHSQGAVYLELTKPGRWRAVHTQGPLVITRPDSLPHGDIVLDIPSATPLGRVVHLAWQAMVAESTTPEAA